MDKEMLKGSIELLLLSLISKKDCYGYEMAKALKEYSDDLYTISEGTLYPALKRLESKNTIVSYWHEVDGGKRRKYYQITEDGQKELANKRKDWLLIENLIRRSSEGLI